MEATVLPDTATNTDVTWESDTPGVATVDAYGQVTAVAAGVTTITAKQQMVVMWQPQKFMFRQ